MQATILTLNAEPGQPEWARYPLGVAALLRRRGARLGGFDLLIDSDLPVGKGLSSSAALVVSTALALAFLAGEPLETTEMVDLCCGAEREFAGVPCGIMDPSALLLCIADHALFLDCRSRKSESVRVDCSGRSWLVIDSGIRHDLADGQYAARRAECGEAVAYFRRVDPKVRSLRDVPSETVRKHALQMPPLAAARSLHVTTENERACAAVAALKAKDLAIIGRLMNDSHRSLSLDYEVSTASIDRLQREIARSPGVLGARLTGAGFGGSLIALAMDEHVAGLGEKLLGGPSPMAAGVKRIVPSAGAAIFQV